MRTLVLHSPAKINLFLAVTGRRDDGFHDLVSLVAPLRFGDMLWFQPRLSGGPDRLKCEFEGVPTGPENLILKALTLLRERAGLEWFFDIQLDKHIPLGAGLGGGSSNAVAALKAGNALLPEPLTTLQLAEIAAELGSDCPLFLAPKPVIMRGRGERLEPLDTAVTSPLRGMRLIVAQPEFSVPTAWAYGALKTAGQYDDATKAESLLASWQNGDSTIEPLLYNRFESVVERKFLTYPVLRASLPPDLASRWRLTGSGSATFGIVHGEEEATLLKHQLRECWGADSFLVETCVDWP